MDKQQIFSFIQEQLTLGKISNVDLLTMVGSTSPTLESSAFLPGNNTLLNKIESPKNISHALYGIGAVIAVVGVGILVSQNWEDIGFLGRAVVTLGISLSTYIGALLLKDSEQKIISQVMFTISATLAPLGSYILLKEASIDFDWSVQFATALVSLVVFGTALFITRRNILVLITTAFVSWAYYAIILKLFESFGLSYYDSDFMKWAVILLGVSYVLLAHSLSSLMTSSDISDDSEKISVQGILYGLGSLSILGAGISVGGMFDIIYISFIFGAFYGSVYLKSRAMLIFGALFLMAHIVKLTSKYFLDSIGWPVALIGIGFLVVGVGYLTYNLNKRLTSG